MWVCSIFGERRWVLSLDWARTTLRAGVVKGKCLSTAKGACLRLPSSKPRRASALSLLPSRFGRPEPAPAPVAAAATAGGCGERGARA